MAGRTPTGSGQGDQHAPDHDQARADAERAQAEQEQAAKARAEANAKDAEASKPRPRRWIADTFQGVVHVHNVDGAGTSRQLYAGDEIPPGYEGQIKSHIPTTGTQPRSSRLREVEAQLGDDTREPTFDPREHTVAEVNAYLEANPEDVQRVLDLERSATGRIRILRRD